MSENRMIESLKRAVLEKYGRTLDSPTDYDELSRTIEHVTGAVVSPTTLKRLYGYVRPATVPRPSTLSILARYVGYTGWSDFCGKIDWQGAEVEKAGGSSKESFEESVEPSTSPRPRRVFVAVGVVAAAVALAALILVIFMLRPVSPPSEDGRQSPGYTNSADSLRLRYEIILDKCLEETRRQCDKVWEQYGKMDILDFYNYVQTEHSRIVFTDLKSMIEQEISGAFTDPDQRRELILDATNKCRDYSAQRLLGEFPMDELQNSL